MRPQLATMLVILSTFSVSGQTVAEDDQDACGALLCLGGAVLEYDSYGECDEYISKYFSIKRKKHGHFSESRTADARREFIDGCKDGDKDSKDSVDSKYGRKRSGI